MNLEMAEFSRQNNTLNFIASENYPSEKILEANSSIFMAKYAEGFSCLDINPITKKTNSRYYNGVEVVDNLEYKCIKKCLETFNADSNIYNANVQMSSGSQANITVYHALLKTQDIVLSPDTASLGHVSHGIKGSFLDTYFNVKKYGLDSNGIINYNEVEELALEYKPKLIICGASNYSQIIDFKRFKEIADKIGATLMADISHIAGLVVAGLHPSPVGLADVITTTLHKTMKGVRGAIIIYKNEFDRQIKFATIPGLWGGSHLNNTLAKLQTFEEAMQPEFKEYINQVVKNTKIMADTFTKYGIPMVSGGTQNHLLCLDLTKYGINGKELAVILEECGVVANCNAIPNDTSFVKPHGLRLGCAPVTTRGLTEEDILKVSKDIAEIIVYFEDSNDTDTCKFETLKDKLKNTVNRMVYKFPLSNLYPNLYKKLYPNCEDLM